jgi:hypothetical protein
MFKTEAAVNRMNGMTPAPAAHQPDRAEQVALDYERVEPRHALL